MYLVQKKGKGVYYMVDTEVLPDGTKKKVWRSTKTDNKEQAEAILAETEASKGLVKASTRRAEIRDLIVERATAVSGVLVQSKTSFAGAWKVYLNDPRTQALKDSSLARVRSCWEQMASCASVDYIEKFTYDDAQAYIQSLKATKASGTVMLHKTALQGVFKRIRRPLGLPDNPFTDLYVPRPVRKEHRCFTDEEIRKILNILPEDGEWYAVCVLSLYTGLRFGDCCTLLAEEVLPGRIVRDARKVERYGKEAEVIIPIHPELTSVLERRKKECPSGLLFPELAKEYEGDSPSKYFGELLRALSIQKKDDPYIVDFHSFRHTFNTRLIDSDADVGVRLKLTGHSNVRTNQLYNHAGRALTEAINRLPSVIKG